MITYEEALKIAREKTSGFTHCTEMEDAFIFGNLDSLDIGGNLPIVIMKTDGFATIMPEYITMCHGGKELRQFKIE